MSFLNTISQKAAKLILVVIITLSLFFRLFNITHGISIHPDERHIMMVTNKLSLDDMNPHFFAYGSFPFYLLWVVSQIFGYFDSFFREYDGLFILGRSISAIAGSISVLLTYILAKKVYNNKFIAITAAVFLCFNVFHLQLSRFYAFDILLTVLNAICLIYILDISNHNRWKDYLIVGFFIGLSLATKISALSLFIPLFLAIIFSYSKSKDNNLASYLIKFQVTIFIAAIIFLLVEPYAVLDFKTFLKNNTEQINMVTGKWRPPFTVQYSGTKPWVYHIYQIFNYTCGWAISILMLAGILIAAKRIFTKVNHAEVIILSWAVIVFLIIGRYQVKFPRYLINLYPVFMIFAACGAVNLLKFISERLKLKENIKWGLFAVFIIWLAIKALAFSSIYSKEHSYKTASVWIYENIEEKSKLLFGHWDDRLPQHLPGFKMDKFDVHQDNSELKLYEKESPENLKILAERIFWGDYVIFPTQRLTGSLTLLPDEYPYANAFFRLLYSGNLGFKLVQTFKVTPEFGPFKFNDDLADESFSVYDHPKVTIFKKFEKLTASEIEKRLLNPNSFAQLPDREQILLKDLSDITPVNSGPGSVFSLIIWYSVISAISFLSFPLIRYLLPELKDQGYGLSKTFGVFIFGYICWILPSAGLLNVSRFNVIILSLILLVACLRYFSICQSELINTFKTLSKHILIIEFLFLFCFLFFSLIRALNPAIFWGEKPMDFTLLNYFTRIETLPPDDPWSAGNQLKYYYLGTYFFSMLTKLTGVDPAIAYNLAIATLPAILVCGLYTIMLWLLRSAKLAVVFSLIVLFVSNLEIANLLLLKGKEINFHAFWASTRFFNSPQYSAITEYPLWSFIFADLHAHVIALPFTVLLLGLGIKLTLRVDLSKSETLVHRLFYAAVLGCLFAINSWDYIVYSIVTAGLILIRPIQSTEGNKFINFIKDAALRIGEIFFIFSASIFFILPFYLILSGENSFSWGWNHKHEYNTLWQVFKQLGLWVVFALIGLCCLIISSLRQKSHLFTFTIAKISLLLIDLSLLFFVFFIESTGKGNYSYPFLGAVFFILILLNIVVFYSRTIPVILRLPLIALVSAVIFIVLVESVFMMDRMNTVFKFYNSIWILMAVSSVGLFRHAIKSNLFNYVRPLFIIPLVMLSVQLIGSAFNIYIISNEHKIRDVRPSLNGMLYMKEANLNEFNLINWINSNIKGLPLTAEAQGHSYGQFTRISMNTGLPTLIGWEHHIKQRGTDPSDVEKRKLNITALYNGSLSDAISVVNNYGIKLIVVGELERATYEPAGLKKFTEKSDIFYPLFQSNDTVIYAIKDTLKSTPLNHKLKLEWID